MLPKKVMFEGIGRCAYVKGAFAKPTKGEFYLSGARVMAYKASNDLLSPYQIVRPIDAAAVEAKFQALGLI